MHSGPTIPVRTYSVHGLTLTVDGALPLELPGASGEASIAVHANVAPAWAHTPLDPARTFFRAEPDDDTFALSEAGWTSGGEGIRLRYAEGATFWISASLDTIWTAYDPPLTATDAAYFLLEPVLAFVLRRRGAMALHASAVAFGGWAVVFCGPAGSGKSTAAAACVVAGAELLADDLVVLSESGSDWLANPGVRAIRLWDEGARALLARVEQAPQFSPTWEKRVLSAELMGGRVCSTAVPLALICFLADRDVGENLPRMAALAGQAALTALIANTSANYLHDAEHRADELQQLARLLANVPAVQLVAHADPDRLRALPEVVRRQLDG